MNKQIIQKIEKPYVSDTCVQAMFAYNKNLAIIDDDNKELLFYHNYADESDNKYINKYVSDDRRKQFPYSNIPRHTKKILFKKYNVVNQLLDYNCIYKIVRNTKIGPFVMYCKVFKDGDNAILVQSVELSSIFSMTVDELKQFNFTKTPEPNINLKINNQISEEDINQAKKLVKTKH